MAKVSMTTQIPASAKAAWDMIGGFNTLSDWHPAIEKSELDGEDGSVRRLSLVGGGVIVEKLQNHDDGGKTYSYSIEDGPLPVANYHSTISVSEGDGEGDCTVEWSSEFDAASGVGESDAVAAIQGVYQAGLDNLKKMFGG